MPTLGPETVIVVQPPAAPVVTAVPPQQPAVFVVPTPGPQGPQGLPGGGATVYTQSIASAQWTINTGLGRNPYGLLVIVGNAEVIADVAFPSPGQIIVTFAAPATGTVSYF